MASSYAAAPPGWRREISSDDIAFLEKALVFAGLVVFMGTFRTLLSGGGEGRVEGNLLFQALAGGIYLSALVILVHRGIPQWLFAILLAAAPLVALTFLPVVSTLWSFAPSVTLRRAIALVLTASFAAYVVCRLDLRTFFNLLVGAYALFIGVAIASAAVGVGVTGGGVYEGAWMGFTGHKNELGRTIALGAALLPIAALLRLTQWRYLALLLTPLALVLVLLSRSATSLISLVGGLGLGTLLYVTLGGRLGRSRLRPDLGIPLLVLGVLFTALTVAIGMTFILEAVGRDATLTGRTDLWAWAIGLNEGREWLGAGYRAFWIDSNTRYFFEYFQFWHMDADGNKSETYSGPTHSHSGYVDVRVELGYVGLIMLAAMLFWALVGLRRALAADCHRIGFIFAFIFSFQVIYITTERSVLQQSDDLWFYFMTFYLMAIRETMFSQRTITRREAAWA